jgi:truncated hemoglobin YjbI
VSVSSVGLFGQAAKEKSLYSRLGGKKSIAAVVDEFVGRVAADKRINAFFGATASDAKRLKTFKATWSIRSARRAAVPASTRERA